MLVRRPAATRHAHMHKRPTPFLWPTTLVAAACLCAVVWCIFAAQTHYASLATLPHILVAYERIPQIFDGAELYLTVTLSALAKVARITFLARSTTGSCKPSSADERALRAALPGPYHAIVRGDDAPIGSVALRALVDDASALLLPVSVLEDTCGGRRRQSENGSATAGRFSPAAAEEYAGYIRETGVAKRIAVFSYDAHAARARSLAAAEDVYASVRDAYSAAAALLEQREAALYGAADSLVVLTAEDAAATPPARGPTLVAPFRFTVPAELVAASPAGRAAAVAAAVASSPRWAARSGFVFVGSGDNPTNALALRAFLRETWPAVRQALPGAQLRVVGRPPRRLCAAHGAWCGGWADRTLFEGGRGGVVELGLVEVRSVCVAVGRLLRSTSSATRRTSPLSSRLRGSASRR